MEFQVPPRFDNAPFMYHANPYGHHSPSEMATPFPPYESDATRRPSSGWGQPTQNPWFSTPATASSEPPAKRHQSMSQDDLGFGPLNEPPQHLPHVQRSYEMAPPSMTTAVTSQSFSSYDATTLPPTTAAGTWAQKPAEDAASSSYDDAHDIIQYYTDINDDNNPVIHLNNEQDFQASMAPPSWVPPQPSPKRLSDSSFSQASSAGYGPLDELPSVETAFPRASSEAAAWNTSPERPHGFQTPSASPAHQHVDALKSGSRSRGSPTPRSNVRSSPYDPAASDRTKRWTVGPSAPTQFTVPQYTERFPPFHPQPPPQQQMGLWTPQSIERPQQHGQQLQMSNAYYPQSNLLQTFNNHPIYRAPEQQYSLANPRPLPSQGLFRLLHSNIDAYSHGFGHTFEHSEPPDLYSSLREEASDPPPEDMNPSDPDLVPHEQELRFAGDLYTPRWVRGHGNKREGWCGLCKPGRWLVLKNSAFWYDKSFTHGVSAATGVAFQGPGETRRTEGNSDVWEGSCGSCGDWVSLVSSKKKGTTWFRHAYKCHTHPKVKDAPKRRRETAASMRARTTSSGSGTSPPHLKSESEPSQTPLQQSNPHLGTFDNLGLI